MTTPKFLMMVQITSQYKLLVKESHWQLREKKRDNLDRSNMPSLRRRFSFRRGSINDRTRKSLRKNSDIQKFGVSTKFEIQIV